MPAIREFIYFKFENWTNLAPS